ncbi:MAG TPA: S41 family peptidase [Caulobacteraceae bacterium]|nr:S41 family peptidase [Caulobacteraceae bacterium]
MPRALFAAGFTAAAVLASTATAQEAAAPAPENWGALLEADARAIHRLISDHHPGPHDRLNPEFRAVLDSGLALALERSKAATSRAHCWWALRQYVASFDDGHTALMGTDKLTGFPLWWPGFYTVEGNGRHVVAVRGSDAAPPKGAILAACDGRDAETLARENVGRFRGLWFLRSQRAVFADQIFRAPENPYVVRPNRCTFVVDGVRTTYDLTWSRFDEAAIAGVRDQLEALPKRGHDPIGLRPLKEGWWITASAFPSDPAEADGKALTALVAEVKARSADLRKARRIVFDLRGNNGGSSHWSREIAQAIWGDAYVDAVSTPLTSKSYVEWRVSGDTIAHLEQIADRYAPVDKDMEQWARSAAKGMREAQARGEPLWRQPRTQEPGPPKGTRKPGRSPVAARVYLLTDSGCGSACLDAADLWLALGAVQVGQETFADSQYMEIRDVPLPSGYGVFRVPTKVYRDRPRGPNQSLKPRHPYAGDMSDTKALEAWIATLP